MNKIIEEDFECLDKHITKALTFDKDNVYKISDFIELLQKAMEKYGDKEIGKEVESCYRYCPLAAGQRSISDSWHGRLF